MAKIAMIGAGSLVFGKTLMADFLATPALAGSEYRLMALTRTRLDKMAAFVQRMIKDNRVDAKVIATTDRRQALKGADYVVVMIQAGGVEEFRQDYEIPLKYGVDQCIGDTMGPGGVFRALRHIPALLEVARDMQDLCPNAILFNYANPMAMCCWALGRVPGLQFVGLCHGVQTTMDLISSYVGVPKDKIDYLAAGINHMAWFLKLEHKGRDLYPTLKKNFEKPGYYVNEKVRGEVLRHFGYFMTESTGHLSEYLPYFRKNRKALDLYCDEPDFGGESGAYYKYCAMLAEKFAKTDPLSIESTKLGPRSAEYCSHIIEAKETGDVFRLNGNIRNDGFITNLPAGCCVEVPIYVDRTGLHPTFVGNLPLQCAALNMTNVLNQGLTVEASLSGDPELVMQAVALDPLTASVLTLKETRDMVAEMLEAEKRWLPQFAGKKLRPVPTIRIPKNVRRQEVPLDPALAIANRFMKLAKA
ncbi:MAG: alpha-glucosidase/alpha-galactosidase [Candidatus Aminicenantes bacterium RBG_19FT_COMBO_58_17]|nr:MAG: alpha-glucosidase/alpha-galactosidase [Candidatus Aminicenantes bacterium RBG_19FT_COMBO_58_17]HCS47189.1 alpha-glucosidase/alpha-galactosidase [Candidatus Aminicenantes bacterium]